MACWGVEGNDKTTGDFPQVSFKVWKTIASQAALPSTSGTAPLESKQSRAELDPGFSFSGPSKVWTELESSPMLPRGARKVTEMRARGLSSSHSKDYWKAV